jgi:hypothetical protein
MQRQLLHAPWSRIDALSIVGTERLKQDEDFNPG